MNFWTKIWLFEQCESNAPNLKELWNYPYIDAMMWRLRYFINELLRLIEKLKIYYNIPKLEKVRWNSPYLIHLTFLGVFDLIFVQKINFWQTLIFGKMKNEARQMTTKLDEVIKVKNDGNDLKSGKKSWILMNYFPIFQESRFCIFVGDLSPEIENQSQNSHFFPILFLFSK